MKAHDNGLCLWSDRVAAIPLCCANCGSILIDTVVVGGLGTHAQWSVACICKSQPCGVDRARSVPGIKHSCSQTRFQHNCQDQSVCGVRCGTRNAKSFRPELNFRWHIPRGCSGWVAAEIATPGVRGVRLGRVSGPVPTPPSYRTWYSHELGSYDRVV
jgi:hypothetical protein